MSASLSSVMEAEKMAGLRRVFCVRLAAVRSRLLGISREDERALRREHLVEGVDWREFGNGIWYAADGVAKLEGVLAGATPMTNDKVPNDKGMTNLDTGGQADLDETGISADRRSASAMNTVPTEAAQPVVCRPRVLALLPERAGTYQGGRGEAFLVRVMKVGFRNQQVVEVKIEMANDKVPNDKGMTEAQMTRGFMRVRTGGNFLPGMLCWARVEEGAGCWVFCGRGDRAATEAPVCPRARGRW